MEFNDSTMVFNDAAYSKKMFGVVDGVIYTQHERVDEINDRIYARSLAPAPLQPNFDPRPTSTKYALFPMLETKKPIEEPLHQYLDYSVSRGFNPGNGRSPVNTMINNIEVESLLRNQFFALQKNDRAVYVPDSTSDLYKVTLPRSTNRNEEQPYPSLFETYQPNQPVSTNITEHSYIGNGTFFNHTRTQLRNGQ